MTEEMEFHINRLVEQLKADGMDEAEARAEAARRFGDRTRWFRETIQEDRMAERSRAWRDRTLNGLREWRLSVRSLIRKPGFLAFSVLPLGLAFAGLSLVAGIVEQVLLRPLPYADEDRLVVVRHPVPGLEEGVEWNLSQAGYHFFRRESRSLEALGVWVGSGVNVSDDESAARVSSALVSASLFDVLGAKPARGRLFVEEDNAPDAARVVVLDHGFWQSRFGGDPAVVGTVIRINSEPAEVVGILAEGFQHPVFPVDIWTPLRLDETAPAVNSHFYQGIGRLALGVSAEQAQSELAAYLPSLPERFPQAYSTGFLNRYRFGISVGALRSTVVGEIGRTLWLLLAAAAAVLLVALANVLGLFVLRSEVRGREFAIRSAVGASRGRLLWSAISETVTVTGAALALATVASFLAFRALASADVPMLPSLITLRMGPLSWALLGVLFLVSTLVLALPAGSLGSGRESMQTRGRRTGTTRARIRTREGLTVVQVGLALVLATGAGLLLRTVYNLRTVDLGFVTTELTVAKVSLPPARYRDYDAVWAFLGSAAQALEAQPGIDHVGFTTVRPLSGNDGCSLVFVEGYETGPDDRPPCITTQSVTPGYFQAMGIKVAGTLPRWVDGPGADVTVSGAMADRFWPDRDPMGRGVRGNGEGPPFYRVAGVAGDVRQDGLREPLEEVVYFPVRPVEDMPLWGPPRLLDMAVRGPVGTAGLAAAIRTAFQDIDPEVAVSEITPMEAVVGSAMARETLALIVIGAGAFLTLLLSAVGLYGLFAYMVKLKSRDIGVRMALGATGQAVRLSIIVRSLVLGLVGVGAGIIGTFLLARLLQSVLFDVPVHDLATLGLVIVAILATVLAASWVPARRAANVDPMEALRAD